jgi:hypothetical protein
MKSILSVTFFICFTATVFAQAPNWQWAKTSMEISDSKGNSVCTDKFGNIYVAGYFADTSIIFGSITLPFTNGQAQYSNLFLVKYDEWGNVLWAKKAGGGQLTYNRAESVAVDDSGNVFITGAFADTVVFGSTQLIFNSSLGQHLFLAKYNSSGNVLWAKQMGGSAQDVVHSVATDAFGNSYVTGAFYASPTATFGNITLTNSSNDWNMFIAKYDPNGNVIWAKNAGGWGGMIIGYSVTGDNNGNCYVVGEFIGLQSATFGSHTLPCINHNGTTFLVKYNSNGAALWARGSGGNTNAVAQSVSRDAAGNIFMAGYFYSGNANDSVLTFGSITLYETDPSSNLDNVFLVKYDTLGQALWAQNEGGLVYNDVGNSVFADSSGNSYLTGTFSTSTITFGSFTLARVGNKNLFLVKYDPLGTVLWAKSVDATTENDSYSVAVDSAGNCFITGQFFDPTITFGSTVLTGASPYGQMFVAKTSFFPMGINSIETSENKISIYPNPFNSFTTIQFNSTPQNAELNIYDVCGQKIKSIKNISTDKIEIDRGDLPSGIYFVRLMEKNKLIETEKIIITD